MIPTNQAVSSRILTSVLVLGSIASAVANDAPSTHARQVMADQPAAMWMFQDDSADARQGDLKLPTLAGRMEGSCQLAGGPVPPNFPLFSAGNRALALSGAGSFVRVRDPGQGSVFDFGQGDSITLEAWVNPAAITEGQQSYIIGKGRTQNPGVPRDNQNFALRLRGLDGTGRISFLFRSTPTAEGGSRNDFHRWNSHAGLVADGQWHHVAVVYTFGEPDSIRGYIDGQATDGTWDIGGPTTAPPVVDDDELWIGSSMGGSVASTFQGGLDEIALYRHRVPAARLQARYQKATVDPLTAEMALAEDLPAKQVLVELFNKTPASQQWSMRRPQPTLQYAQDGYGFIRVPKLYSKRGVTEDWTDTLMLRARSRLSLPVAGEFQFMLRYKSAARLYVDGKLIAQTELMSRNASGHEAVPPRQYSGRADVHALLPGMQEKLVSVRLPAGDHLVRLEAVVGGKGVRLELGELSVGFAPPEKPMQLLTAAGASPLGIDDDAWEAYRARMATTMRDLDSRHRQIASTPWRTYWQFRHDLAREAVAERPAIEVPKAAVGTPVHNAIDHFVGATRGDSARSLGPLTSDTEFLRRVTLDTVGVIPSLSEVDAFLAAPPESRRAAAIDRLLDDPRWADHWVAYWQDVLAENPGILKPKLNNTGPFRWWIYESFLDNKPMDQFVTELVLMEGSKYAGGPAGFSMATENDAPMAAKAHVLAQAFLGLDMKCARCHDAPYHPFKQEQLFNLAAMLKRQPTKLPKTSTVPTGEGGRKPLIEISLKPGQTIDPIWPFAYLAPELPPKVLNDEQDHRERLAASITSPHNERFAKVIANRLWQRYLGRGLVEPVDDWESDSHSVVHSELLDFMARDFVLQGYDVKQLARLILNSYVYQCRPRTPAADSNLTSISGPIRRRMSAEQLVDSLFTVSRKPMDAESLTLDPEGRRPSSTFLNLGVPERAWQFTSLSNERDRPALALPMAQSMIDLLMAYGWRDARPNPISVRDEVPTMLQPLTLANGVVGRRAVCLSDDHAITALCLQPQPVEQFVERIFLQILTRRPSDEEAALLVALLADGYESRVVAGQPIRQRTRVYNPVSWSNHLSAEATQIKQEMQRAVQAGDLPTQRLTADWRQRAEDAIWSLINSPEFAFLP